MFNTKKKSCDFFSKSFWNWVTTNGTNRSQACCLHGILLELSVTSILYICSTVSTQTQKLRQGICHLQKWLEKMGRSLSLTFLDTLFCALFHENHTTLTWPWRQCHHRKSQQTGLPLLHGAGPLQSKTGWLSRRPWQSWQHFHYTAMHLRLKHQNKITETILVKPCWKLLRFGYSGSNNMIFSEAVNWRFFCRFGTDLGQELLWETFGSMWDVVSVVVHLLGPQSHHGIA